jgi:hypothetical protein
MLYFPCEQLILIDQNSMNFTEDLLIIEKILENGSGAASGDAGTASFAKCFVDRGLAFLSIE